jgi:regulator of sigma E protease
MDGDLGGSKSLSGPIGIASVFGSFDYIRWLRLTGIMMIVFAFYEVIPLPKSAAFRSLPLLYEMMTRKTMSRKAFENLRKPFWIILVLGMLWVVFNDIIKLI